MAHGKQSGNSGFASKELSQIRNPRGVILWGTLIFIPYGQAKPVSEKSVAYRVMCKMLVVMVCFIKSPHQALNALFARQFGSSPSPATKTLFAAIEKLDADLPRKRALCTVLTEVQRPAYMPLYMIAHGLEYGSGREPLIEDFDSEDAWRLALRFVQCKPD